MLGEDVPLLHPVRPLAASERLLVEANLGDEVERVVIPPNQLAQLVEVVALGGEGFERGPLPVGVVPCDEELIERHILGAQRFLRVVP